MRYDKNKVFEDYSPRKGFKCYTYLNNAKSWHEIFIADAEQFSRKLKEKELKNNNNHED